MVMKRLIACLLTVAACAPTWAQGDIQVREPGFKVFQFPRTAIPRLDGEFSEGDADSIIVGDDDPIA